MLTLRPNQGLQLGTMCLRRVVVSSIAKPGGGVSGGNYQDIESGEEYWVSGVKKNGLDRHWAGSDLVAIEASIVGEYLQLVGATELDRARFKVINDLHETSSSEFHDRENEKFER